MILTIERAEVEEEKIRTCRPNGKGGVVISKRVYDEIRFSILTTICINQQLTINDLLEKCSIKSTHSHVEISWVILQVKLDLEARGMIKTHEPDRPRALSLIKLTRLGWQELQLYY